MFQNMSLTLKLRLAGGLLVMLLLLTEVITSPWITAGISIITYILVAYPVLKGAVRDLFVRHRMSEQFLMTIATFGAFGLQDYAEALAVMIFYLIGQSFEDYAAQRSHNEIASLVNLKPREVRLIKEDGSEEIVKPRKVKIGSTIRILSGEAIALDGTLRNTYAAVDLSALNGESEPAAFVEGQEIPSGGINVGGVIELTVTRDVKNSSLTRLINLIEDAATNKSIPETLISRFATYYTPAVVTCACLLALVPVFVTDADFASWITRALVFLVVSCPCALVLSVPLSFFGGLGAISKVGVMVKGSVHIETLARLKAVAFDKTGTLTHGRFQVLESTLPNDEALSYLYSLEKMTTHPIGTAIATYCKDLGIPLQDATEVTELTGSGLQGTVNGHKVIVGKARLVHDILGIEAEKSDLVGTEIFVIVDDKLLGRITLADEVRSDAEQTSLALQERGIDCFMITGDRQAVAADVAEKCHLSNYFAEQLPEDKLNNLKALKEKYGTTAFVGDGINDAPALASSDVGIAMGQFGSAQAVEAADVVVMTDDLNKIPTAIDLARRTYTLAMQNLVFVIAIKLLILILGAFGIANIWMAIFGDVGLCILAVLNAMRTLTWVKTKPAQLQVAVD